MKPRSSNARIGVGELAVKNRVAFPGGLVVKTLPANAGDTGLISDLGRFHIMWNN